MGNNYCKQLGIKAHKPLNSGIFDLVWKKYDRNEDNKLSFREARHFLKQFSKAIGAPYDKPAANKLILEILSIDNKAAEVLKPENLYDQFLTRDQFGKLFLVTLKQNQSKVVLSSSLRLKLHKAKVLPKFTDPNKPEEVVLTVDCHPKDSKQEIPDEVLFESLSELQDPVDWENAVEEPKKQEYKSPFEIVAFEELEKQIMKTLKDLCAVLGLGNVGHIILLLSLVGWSKDKLLSVFFDQPEKFLVQCGVILDSEDPKQIQTRMSQIGFSKAKSPSLSTMEDATDFECPVCLETVPMRDTFALQCGHRNCVSCWKESLNQVVTQYGSQIMHMSKCLFPKCTLRVPLEEYELLADPGTAKRYRYFFVKNFVQGNNYEFTFCPNDCGRAVKYLGHFESSDEFVECACGKQFCFYCGAEHHNPVSCDQLRIWNLKQKDDTESDSLKLITAIAKPCPNAKCGIATDRVDGCNHMSCQKCGHQWCWQCRGSWVEHGDKTGGFYFCNKYASSDAKKLDEEADRLMEEHNRYLHYYNGFFINDRAEKACQMKTQFQQKAKKYKEITGADEDFLSAALETLIRCRHIIKYTYVYGYFHCSEEESPHRLVFEVQQAFAQNICERLAKALLDKPESLERNKIVYLHQACKQYFSNLVQFFESDTSGLYCVDEKTLTKRKKKIKKAKEQTSHWICPQCTYGNVGTASVCELCEFVRSNDPQNQDLPF